MSYIYVWGGIMVGMPQKEIIKHLNNKKLNNVLIKKKEKQMSLENFMLLETFTKGKNLKISVKTEILHYLHSINGWIHGMKKDTKGYIQNTIKAAVFLNYHLKINKN